MKANQDRAGFDGQEVQVPPLSAESLQDLIDPGDWSRLQDGLALAPSLLFGREVWNVNSTAAGGGVSELLWSWIGLARGQGISTRWLTIQRTQEFFTLTKRLHSRLLGELGDGGKLGEDERRVYERISRTNAEALIATSKPRDIVFLHDPQTAGMIPHVARTGRTVIWRCHIGTDETNEHSRDGWEFLAPYLHAVDACVFYREDYVPDCCRETPTALILPSIDPLSAKNRELGQGEVEAILRRTGLLAGAHDEHAPFTRAGGETAMVSRSCELTTDGKLPGVDTPLVVQVSRWDRLKDPTGVMHGFAGGDVGGDAHLVLAGPTLGSLSGGGSLIRDVREAWHRLPPNVRGRTHLACLPIEDREENGVIVNALQRQARLVVQKSLKEGFGLTVAEAMWKARPVIATEIGGIRNQIEHGVTGLMLPDPLDLEALGAAMSSLLDEPERGRRLGVAARESVRRSFLPNRAALQYVALLERLSCG